MIRGKLVILLLVVLLCSGGMNKPQAHVQAPAQAQAHATLQAPPETPAPAAVPKTANVEAAAAPVIAPLAGQPVDASEPATSPAPAGAVPPGKTFADLAPTVNMTFAELVGDNGEYDDPPGHPAPGTFHVIVDIAHQVVMVYKKGSDGTYTEPVRYMSCSTGSGNFPTRRGIFETGEHKVRFGYFVNDHVYGQYWTHIVSRTYFHSLLYTKRSAGSYTRDSYKNIGKRASHGCIRLLVPDARWLYYHLAPGSTVEIRKGSKDDALTASIKEQLTRPSAPKNRPKLVKGEIPHTDNWSIATYLREYTNTVSFITDTSQS